MKKIFSFTKKKKHQSGTPDSGSVLSAGYDLKEKDLGKVHKAALSGDLAKLKQLAKKNDINQLDKENRTPLHIACANGHAEVVQFLVDSKAKLNLCDNQNRSALMKAVQGQHERCVSILLENHAEPNLVDINGNTALHLAANIPSISTAVLLLQHGAEINAQNKEGFTPLTVAVREDHMEMTEFLLKESADVNSLDQDQRSPLMLAAGNEQINMVKLLLQFDADVTLKDTKGWSADDYAAINGHHLCSHLIIEHSTQKTNVSRQGPSKKKKMLGSPSHDVEAGFSLGGPAIDKDEHGANEAGGDLEDNSQSESVSRVSKSAADEWPSSEDEDESVLNEKKPLQVNITRMFGSTKGEGDSSAGSEEGKHSEGNKRIDSQEESSAGEDSEEEEDNEEGEDDNDDDDDDNEEEEEEDEGNEDEESDAEEENEEEDESEEEEDASCDFEDAQKSSIADVPKISLSADTQKAGTSLRGEHEKDGTSEENAKSEPENTDLGCPAVTANAATPATLDVVEDCVVSAIRVESTFSDDEESLAKECLTSNQKIISNQGSTEVPMPLVHQSPREVKEEEFERETEKDHGHSWSDNEDIDAKVWSDSDDDVKNKTGGSGHSTLIAFQRHLVAKVGSENTDSLSDADDVAGSNRKQEEKHRSSWGSSLEGSGTDVPKESENNRNVSKQESGFQTQHSKDAVLPNDEQPDSSWDSSLPVASPTKCVSPRLVLNEERSCTDSVTGCPQPKTKPSVEESERDDRHDRHDIGSTTKCEAMSSDLKSSIAPETMTKQEQEGSWEEEDKESVEKESNDPSPVVSTGPEDDDDNDHAESVAQSSQMEGKSDSENDKEGNSWDDEDESVESEKQRKREATPLSRGNLPSLSSRPKVAVAKKAEKAKADNIESDGDNEVIPHSIIDEKSNDDKLVVPKRCSLSKDDEWSEDSDSTHQKLQYDFASATAGTLSEREDSGNLTDRRLRVDGDDARLTSYVPLENKIPVGTKTRESCEGQISTYARSSPPPKDDDALSDEALPQTDIDDVDVNPPDEAERTDMKWPELRDSEDPQKDDSAEDEDEDGGEEGQVEEEEEGDMSDENNQSEGSGGSPEATSPVPEAGVVKEKKRDFLSELGLEGGEEEPESWDSESNSENANTPHKENQDFHSRDQREMSSTEAPLEEHMFYIPSFLRGRGGSRMAEIGRPQSSQREAGSNGKDENGGEPAGKADTPQKENEKANWERLNVLSKLEGKVDQRDLMEELSLGDVDDLEAQKADASDWDSASTTSKRTLPGRRMASPGIEEFPEDSKVSGNEQEGDAAPAAPSTPQKSSSSDKLPSAPSKSAPQPQPCPRKMGLQEEESKEVDWETDKVASPCQTSPDDNQQRNLAEPPAVVEPGSPELSLMAKDTNGSMEFNEQQQEVGNEEANTAMRGQKSSSLLDGGGTSVEDVGSKRAETGSGYLSNQPAGIHQEEQPVAAQRAPALSHLPVQQSCNSKKQEKPQVVRGARPSRAPQTNTHVNGDPLSVFDDSSLSDVSDDEERFTTPELQKSKNPEEMDVAEDFDELTQSSDTATDDTDSPTSGYRHASLLIQKLDSATLDTTSVAKLQNIFHEYERSIQKERSRRGYLADKVRQLEMERTELKNSLEEVKDAKSLLERNQLELQTEITNLKFQLKQEQENRHNANMMYNTTRDKLRRTEEQHQLEVQERQKVELTLRNLELEMRTLICNMKQLEEDHSETQRLLAQERSTRVLQENLLSNHLRKQQEMEAENKRNMSKSNEALSQLTEASEREKELLHQLAASQEQQTMLRADLERLQANSGLKESQLAEENEVLKEQLEDVRRDLKLSEDTVTQTVFSCNNQLSALKSELAKTTSRLESERQLREALEMELESTRSRLVGAVKEAELRLAAHSDTEKALLREKEEHQWLKDRHTGEVASQREAVSSLSQKLAKAEARANSKENEVHRVTLQLTEKGLLLDVLQREKDQAAARVKEMEAALQEERESASRASARQEAAQERLAHAQSEAMLLQQQLEEAQNKGVAKERAVTDAQERFSDILSKLRSDSEERVQLIEDRNKELASKAADLRDQIYKLEEEKNERETSLRQLQQELADSLKKLSMSEASLEVNTRYRNDLEEEKTRLLKDLDRIKGKLEESEDQHVQAERHMIALKSSLEEREKELGAAAQKLQEALSASAASETTVRQLEEAVQKLEIENARLEAAAKQQSSKIDALQKGAQEAAMLTGRSPGGGVRGHLEEVVTNLQSSKMTLEEQLNREVQKQSMLSHTAQDSQALWEEELKSRSKLGLRLAELEKEKGELTAQMEVEKKKAKKITEQKKAIDTRLDQEMKRNSELQKEMYRLRTLLKTAKKKLRDQEAGGAEFASPMSSLRMDQGRHRHSQADDLQEQLEKETYRRSQLERTNEELKVQIASMKSLGHNSDHYERSKRQLEEEVLGLRRRLEAAQVEQSQVDQYRREAEEKARQEIQQKLEQVNLFLQSQAASQEALDQIKAANEASLRSQLEQKIRELEGDLGRARTTQQDSLNQRESTRTELERYQQLYTEEMRLRKSLTAKLERANSRLAEANSKLLSERSRSLITSNITNGSLVGPPLDLSSLGSPGNYGATLGPLNRSFGLGLSLLSPAAEGQNSRVEDYLAKMQRELDRNISKELSSAAAELDAASVRMSPVGSASRAELDPVSRATQQYLEVLKKNNRL
ncbi:ankyrin repeat domain-containing protein 26 isoform X8 [Kryptolebias marmoratus]|uniref:ankyrin repeat domain-containing protein 26 isoform X8 n=1 Tax=Kryptolebias marmoratus TaxID=37003 RepID=UPI000D53122B|nr:ankyrin repeat domain-containing protein 26 isoform X8 [Kryptolebias marmoratus]